MLLSSFRHPYRQTSISSIQTQFLSIQNEIVMFKVNKDLMAD
ncbi:hypothetical protein N646_0689 [Vibrio alginolyticus NBRC 15630 = ATCC 17749]|uniref:Uncharacterized protein n=1 Tax=Vibrio alginolyticus (strain ATCC 17749 / DSM 2171 / NBRC 15630 / NCIMB 1903 / NCTC 12160 / XII-53) TaxID=1219076 RepID=A0A2I3C4C5_VIBAX|nr:hypothetical protein N646_0689 [Vibrio alginolyticus NBRC 15630 = ATCC 17749]